MIAQNIMCGFVWNINLLFSFPSELNIFFFWLMHLTIHSFLEKAIWNSLCDCLCKALNQNDFICLTTNTEKMNSKIWLSFYFEISEELFLSPSFLIRIRHMNTILWFVSIKLCATRFFFSLCQKLVMPLFFLSILSSFFHYFFFTVQHNFHLSCTFSQNVKVLYIEDYSTLQIIIHSPVTYGWKWFLVLKAIVVLKNQSQARSVYSSVFRWCFCVFFILI